jgi:protein-tyrosine phosphatase
MKDCVNNVSVARTSNHLLTVRFDKVIQTPTALYWSDSAGKEGQRTLICDDVQSGFSFSDPLNGERRIYLILSAEGGGAYLFGERTLPIVGLNNFRDYGGYRGAGGKRIKWGELYRSNHLHGLAPEAKHYIEALNIQTIIDYRSDHEIAKSPNDFVGEKRNINVDPSAHTAELAAQFAAKPDDENRALIDNVISGIPKAQINGKGEQVLEQYRNFVLSEKSKNAFRRMLQVMLDKDSAPSVQHCRGGKDRTGHGVLLVMTMLGVSKEDMIADYMLTKQNRLARNEYKMEQYRQITQDEDVLGYLLSLIDTRDYFIEEIFKTMESVAGSAENYIKQELGFTDADFLTMQANYLE